MKDLLFVGSAVLTGLLAAAFHDPWIIPAMPAGALIALAVHRRRETRQQQGKTPPGPETRPRFQRPRWAVRAVPAFLAGTRRHLRRVPQHNC